MTLADGRVGRLTEVQRADGGFEALAVVALEDGADPEQDAAPAAGGQDAAGAASVLPLPYAL